MCIDKCCSRNLDIDKPTRNWMFALYLRLAINCPNTMFMNGLIQDILTKQYYEVTTRSNTNIKTNQSQQSSPSFKHKQWGKLQTPKHPKSVPEKPSKAGNKHITINIKKKQSTYSQGVS